MPAASQLAPTRSAAATAIPTAVAVAPPADGASTRGGGGGGGGEDGCEGEPSDQQQLPQRSPPGHGGSSGDGGGDEPHPPPFFLTVALSRAQDSPSSFSKEGHSNSPRGPPHDAIGAGLVYVDRGGNAEVGTTGASPRAAAAAAAEQLLMPLPRSRFADAGAGAQASTQLVPPLPIPPHAPQHTTSTRARGRSRLMNTIAGAFWRSNRVVPVAGDGNENGAAQAGPHSAGSSPRKVHGAVAGGYKPRASMPMPMRLWLEGGDVSDDGSGR